ncbi:MAG TPA: hypothetical protein VFU71_01665 [Burkholderiaceae bacterium]|nr:hypothetical protein [Burkholderiaceae bacterium]
MASKVKSRAAPRSRTPQSVAGEEDPGAALDAVHTATPAASSRGSGGTGVLPASQPMSPGDEAPPGTPGTGEAVCGRCGGSGRVGNAPCPTCGGSGTVTRGLGGG